MNMLIGDQEGWDIKQKPVGHSTDFRPSFGLIYEGGEYKFPVKTRRGWTQIVVRAGEILEVPAFCPDEIDPSNSSRNVEFRSEPARDWFTLSGSFPSRLEARSAREAGFIPLTSSSSAPPAASPPPPLYQVTADTLWTFHPIRDQCAWSAIAWLGLSVIN